jgi:lysophospholipase L1-like esterase
VLPVGTLNLLDRIGLPTLITAPPTVTVGATNGATSIVSSIQTNPTDLTKFTYTGLAMTAGTYGGYPSMDSSASITSNATPYNVRALWNTDADQFEIFVSPTSVSPNAGFRLWVDGQLVSAAPVTAGFTSGGAFYRILVNFGSRGLHRIVFEGIGLRFLGTWQLATSTVWPSPIPLGPKCMVIGDSFTEGVGATWWWDSWAMTVGRRLGWNVYPSGLGGTGYLATSGGTRATYRSRLASDVINQGPDIVIVSGGVNDWSVATPSQEQAEAGLLFAAIKAGLPFAKLIVVGNFNSGGVTAVGNPSSFRDAQKAAAAGVADLFVDPIIYPGAAGSWFTGTGRVGAVAGNGNSDFFTSADGVHPTQSGHDYLGDRVATAIAAAMPIAA